MLCGIDNIPQNISIFKLKVGNIPLNIVSPTEHWYGSKQCYDGLNESILFLEVIIFLVN